MYKRTHQGYGRQHPDESMIQLGRQTVDVMMVAGSISTGWFLIRASENTIHQSRNITNKNQQPATTMSKIASELDDASLVMIPTIVITPTMTVKISMMLAKNENMNHHSFLFEFCWSPFNTRSILSLSWFRCWIIVSKSSLLVTVYSILKYCLLSFLR